MSKNINVNPDHYKTGGRERQGEAIVQKDHKTKMASVQHDLAARASQRRETIERKASAAREQTGAKKPLFESEKETQRTTAPAEVGTRPNKASASDTKPSAPPAKTAAPKKALGAARSAASKAKSGAKTGARAAAKATRSAVKRAKNAVRGPRQSLSKRPAARKK